MDVETPKATELNLPQAFLLLATNDVNGKPEVPVFALRTTVAGAILAELDLIGAIELQGKRVRDTGEAPETEFRRELEVIRGKSRPHTPKGWVGMLEGRAVVQRVYEGMASLGIVEHVGEKHLGRFRAVRYPEKDHAPEAALLEKIQAALSGAPSDLEPPETTATDAGSDAGTTDAEALDAGTTDAEALDAGTSDSAKPAAKHDSKAPEVRTIVLIALLQAAGMLGKLFPAADLTRANELSKDYWPSRAVEDELRMIRLAEQEAANL
ncbi:GPP34 family phosphoprotein [Pseudarthrobacter sp. AL07]|uniref:GOLPH3/VPS74 family protein n=1 Tax=unclassified Pseudarthrobacter TaxID=2647000 RepID=UPI00249AF339|nr:MULTISPECIES: GPP34 family phosphoprotein [unclassified Pseudarthrobacter]MDI3196097.1 GPP34 family phosphoprotein [Pseudarthrobacter sp. AL20]MDI3210152.1 GPP34 family phosphoprotein [Pseudarthrobacter sp. AL07]